MEITTEMIKELRAATNAGILDCRKALEASDGDFQKAVDFLREKGLATAAKRADRVASQGVVELYSHGDCSCRAEVYQGGGDPGCRARA
jgi:elongation factor Ts